MEAYNINQLFEIAFGIRGLAIFRPEGVDTPPNAPDFDFKGVQVVEDVVEASRISYMGTPIIFPIKFKGGNYRFYNTSGEVERYPVNDFDLPTATLVNFRRAKVKSNTRVLASEGTVKEIYGFDDWVIDIRGLCLKDPGNKTAPTAYDQHLRLLEFENIVDSITVVGDLFADKNIGNITIDEIDFKQVQGKPGIIPFYLRCSSDKPFELEL